MRATWHYCICTNGKTSKNGHKYPVPLYRTHDRVNNPMRFPSPPRYPDDHNVTYACTATHVHVYTLHTCLSIPPRFVHDNCTKALNTFSRWAFIRGHGHRQSDSTLTHGALRESVRGVHHECLTNSKSRSIVRDYTPVHAAHLCSWTSAFRT